MRISTSTGRALTGTWGTGVYVGLERRLYPGNHPIPFGNQQVLAQGTNAAGQPVLVTVAEAGPGAPVTVVEPDGKSRGASYLKGIPGFWAASLSDAQQGMRTSDGFSAEKTMILDVALDGLTYTTTPANQNIAIRGRGPTAPILETVTTTPMFGTPEERCVVRALPYRRLTWVDGAGRVHAYGIDFTELTTRGFWWAQPIEINGAVYLLEASDRLTLRRADSRLGTVLSTGDTFGPDITVFEGRVLVGWAKGVGEQDAVVVDVDLSTLTTRLEADPGVVVPGPVIPLVQMGAYPAWGQKVYCSAYFSFDARYPEAPDVIGNAITLVDNLNKPTALAEAMRRYQAKGYPYVIGATRLEQIDTSLVNNVVAWITEASTMPALIKNVQEIQKNLPEKLIRAHIDDPAVETWPQTRPKEFTDDVVPELQICRRKTESPEQFTARIMAMIDRVRGYGLAMGACFRSDTGFRTQQELETVDFVLYEHFMREGRFRFVHFFSDCREAPPALLGMRSMPGVRALVQAFAAAIPGRPSRYDGWRPRSMSLADVLDRKLAQDVELFDLSVVERRYLQQRLKLVLDAERGH